VLYLTKTIEKYFIVADGNFASINKLGNILNEIFSCNGGLDLWWTRAVPWEII
jgi:hypothetical protein